VALCAWGDVAENPFPDREAVHFVRGDLANEDVMTRACVQNARTAVIDGRDDNETLAIAVAVDHANPGIHLVAAVRDLGRRETLRYVNPGVQVVQWHMPFLLTEEAGDPGLTQVYNDLMSSGGHGNTYSMPVPEGFPHTTFGACQTYFGRTFGATVLALRAGDGLLVSPGWDQPVTAGDTLYYVAGERIDAGRLDARR
jgi:voltage-gated potassium channel